MKKYGLIGKPLEHSYSADYFNEKFKREGIDAQYVNFDLDCQMDLYDLLKSDKDIMGFNVTSPFKVEAVAWTDNNDIIVDIMNSINVMKIFWDNDKFYIMGYNTDHLAFRKSIIPLMQAGHVAALVLGTGGAANSVTYALKQMGIECLRVSRNKKNGAITYKQIDAKIMNHYKLIINCTPVGMFPNDDALPEIPYHFLTPDHLLYDLIYNPEETKFLQIGRKLGAQTKNGLEMFHLQAEESWKIWNNQEHLTAEDFPEDDEYWLL